LLIPTYRGVAMNKCLLIFDITLTVITLHVRTYGYTVIHTTPALLSMFVHHTGYKHNSLFIIMAIQLVLYIPICSYIVY
jgi:hypothetical protein